MRLLPLAEQGLPAGRLLLATFDAVRVVVWQAHRPEVADEAVRTQRFGGPLWRDDRMTRMRLSLPSLLARNGWATRAGRERILAVHLSRAGFDAMIRQAVPADFDPAVYRSKGAWHLATRWANVSITWHRDVDPAGAEMPWDTPRIGVRDHALRAFREEWVIGVEDHTRWVVANRERRVPGLPVPRLAPYVVGGA